MFRELCGEKTLKNVTLMTNMWGKVTPQEGVTREQELREEHFEAAIKKGARMQRHTNTPESARAILREILKNRPAVLKIQRELIDENKDIRETGAGAELNREIRELTEKHQREMKELEEDMRRAAEEKDEESREELEGERRKMEEKMEKLQKDSAEMEHKFEQARREMEERINARFEAQILRIREAYEAEIRKYEERAKEPKRDGRGSAPQAVASKKLVASVRMMRYLIERLTEDVRRWCTTM